MLKKVLKYLDAYIDTNAEVLEPEKYAEVHAVRKYISALMETTLSYAIDAKEKEIEQLKNKVEHLRKLLFTVMKERYSGDVRVKRSEFLEIYKEAMDGLGSDECELYGNDVTVHWHGIYCNCSDGAVSWNHIVQNIHGVIDEDGDD